MITKALFLTYIAWIGAHTSYDVSHVVVPRVEFYSQKEINSLFYHYSGMACKVGVPAKILAFYTDEDGGIAHLNKEINENDLEDQSVVFHETFHHVQYSNKDRMPGNPHDIEVEAMMVENIWRKEHGLKKPDRVIATEFCK